MLTLAEAHRYAELHDNEVVRRALKVRSFAVRRTELQQSELEIPIIDDEGVLTPRASTFVQIRELPSGHHDEFCDRRTPQSRSQTLERSHLRENRY